MPLPDIDLLDPALFVAGPPHETFALLRRAAPVFDHHRPGLPPFWAVTRHADVVRVNEDQESFSSADNGAFLDELPDGPRHEPSPTLLNLDPPEHTRVRDLLRAAFDANRIAWFDRRAGAQSAMILDRVARRGACDVARDIAAELSMAVLGELLGIPDEADRRRVHRLTGIISDPLEHAAPDAVSRAVHELFALGHEVAAWRRRAPADDLLSTLAGATGPAGRLSRREFELLFLLLVTAGHLPAQHTISGGLLALLAHPDQFRLLRDDPTVLTTGADEMVRWVSPVVQFQRTATRDTRIGETPVAKGDRVAIYFASANRDEAAFDRPDRFDLARTGNDHVGFGARGPHRCIGEHLARAQLRALFCRLPRRLPDIELAGLPEYVGSPFANGITSLPVRFTPAA